MRDVLVAAFRAALDASDPARLVARHLPSEPPSRILAVGKAALPMARAAREAFPDVPWLATPPGYVAEPSPPSLLPGAHPIPDRSSVRAAEAALAAASGLGENDRLLVLVSGGGSALWCAPDGIELDAKRAVTRALQAAGADIHELNAVRKHLSRIKGGRLAQATRASVRTLLLSDVPGDDPGTIASGPTVADPTSFGDALEVVARYGVGSPAVLEHLEAGARGERTETPKPGDGLEARTETVTIGSNRHALVAMRDRLERAGHRVALLSDRFEGEARELARFHAGLVRSIRTYGEPFAPPVTLLSGGEATVTVRGDGVGGRNLEFALALMCELGDAGVWQLSAGTDGLDGSSDAAGAVVGPGAWRAAIDRGLDPRAFLARNDAGGFFDATGDALRTGPTQTNVNDVRAIVVAERG